MTTSTPSAAPPPNTASGATSAASGAAPDARPFATSGSTPDAVSDAPRADTSNATPDATSGAAAEATATAVAATMPRLATILRLVAGRGTFRLAIQLMSVALVAVWGGTAFSHYANALGLFAWLPLATATP